MTSVDDNPVPAVEAEMRERDCLRCDGSGDVEVGFSDSETGPVFVACPECDGLGVELVPAPETVEAQDGNRLGVDELRSLILGRRGGVRGWALAAFEKAICAPLEERIEQLERRPEWSLVEYWHTESLRHYEHYLSVVQSQEWDDREISKARVRAEAAEERIRELENRAESVAQLASFNLELEERNAKLREALTATIRAADAYIPPAFRLLRIPPSVRALATSSTEATE